MLFLEQLLFVFDLTMQLLQRLLMPFFKDSKAETDIYFYSRSRRAQTLLVRHIANAMLAIRAFRCEVIAMIFAFLDLTLK